MPEDRQSTRVVAELPVKVRGIDAEGQSHMQDAVVRNISLGGALVSGLAFRLRTGDLMAIQYGEKTARFRVIWTRDSRGHEKYQAAVQRLPDDECLWKDMLEKATITKGRF
ncbi:MAG TPA: PilZ domain-containing protein [Terriglobales bacterium]|jgi:hypothetical protein